MSIEVGSMLAVVLMNALGLGVVTCMAAAISEMLLHCRDKSSHPVNPHAATKGWVFRFVATGALLSLFRIAALWAGLIAGWTGNFSLSLVPLLFVLYPEASLFPSEANGMSAANAVLCSLLYVVGSFALAGFFTLVLMLFARTAKAITRRCGGRC